MSKENQSSTFPKIRVGIVGCGRVAEHYRLMLLEVDPVPGFQIVACCDIESDKASRLAKAFDCPYFNNDQEMFQQVDMDTALILTPSGHHYLNAIDALNNGKHVLIEKPITLNIEEALRLQQLADEKGLSCASVFQNRFNPAVTAVKKAMEQGRFGKLVTASIRLRWCRTPDYYEDGWHGTWENDGGVIAQQAIHHVDALRWICGPVDSLVASIARQVNQPEAEDTTTALVKFTNGCLGTIEATTAARPRDFEASLSIVGEGGTAQIGGIALNQIIDWEFTESTPEDSSMRERMSEEVPTGYGYSHSRLMRDYVTALNKACQPPIPVSEAIPAVELVHAIYSSVESQGWVHLADSPRSKLWGNTSDSTNSPDSVNPARSDTTEIPTKEIANVTTKVLA